MKPHSQAKVYPKSLQGKADLTLRPCHPDLKDALDAILSRIILSEQVDGLAAEIIATNGFIDDQPELNDEDNAIEEMGEITGDEVRFQRITFVI